MSWKIDRRRLITGAGAIFMLPLLESFASKIARADGTSDPLRFVSLYMPNGTYNIQSDAVWYPATGPLTKNLPVVLSPFADRIADFSVLKNVRCRARDQCGGNGGHVSAVSTFLTQAVATDFEANKPTIPGSSFDQMVTDTTKKQQMVLSGGCYSGPVDYPQGANGTLGTNADYSDFVTYKNGQPVIPIKSPYTLYNQMFSNLVSQPGTPPPVPAAARNKSILDSSLADIKDMQSKLGKTDNQKLDDYFTSVRALETKLAGGTVTVTNQCVPGKAPDSSLGEDPDGLYSDKYIARVEAFFDMIALAFKCDFVRSVSFMFDAEGAARPHNPVPPDLIYNGADVSGGLHLDIAHWFQNIGRAGKDRAISRDRMYLRLFFYLLDALKGGTDPSGSPILDNSIVLMGYGVEDGNHGSSGDPTAGPPMVVGGGRNFMHPGNSFDLNGADMTDLFYTFSTFLKMGWANYQGSTNVVNI